MIQRILVIFCCIVFSLGILCGCDDSSQKQTEQQPQAATAEQYKKEASEQINEENMDEELSRLEDAIAQEESLEQ